MTEGGTWRLGEADTGDYSYSLELPDLSDCTYRVSPASIFGSFFNSVFQFSIDIQSDYIIVAPSVHEPANLLLFGTGLFGIAGVCRKKFFQK